MNRPVYFDRLSGHSFPEQIPESGRIPGGAAFNLKPSKMNKTITPEKKVELKTKTYAIGIHRDKTGILVRKSEIVAGIRVPLFETYVLTPDAAIWLQNYLVQELNGFSQN